jgi:hypothetical protein
MFDFSFGYPLQDDLSTGLISMQYGIDKRVSSNDVETDLGVAVHMINNSELPYARNVPLRSIISQMLEEIPGVNVYPIGDPWHLSSDVNIAIASYMYTILTGDCALYGTPLPTDSITWRTYMSYKVGYTTAWNVMHMQRLTPCFDSIISICNDSTWDCTPAIGCFESGAGLGQYSSLSSCQAACNATDINIIDNSEKKILIKIIDILGRKSKVIKNQTLFYIYDDGTVEKKIILE